MYVDSEFRIKKFLIRILVVVVVYNKVNKLVKIKNEPRDLLPNVNKGKQVC